MAKKNEEPELTRRGVLQVFGATPTLAVMTAGAAAAQDEHAHMHPAPTVAAKGPYHRQSFDEHQWRTVGILCNLILPADDRSGSATDAGVPEFLDDWIAFRKAQDGNADLEAQIFGGLMWLNAQSWEASGKLFADAPVEQQKHILDRIAYPDRAAPEDHRWVIFFNRFRDLTISGFYSSKMGIADLPYTGNTIVTNWAGCPPAVWAIIEERMKNGYKGVTAQEVKPWSA
jgi:gluconate 2-dehydrogenase gamma chain